MHVGLPAPRAELLVDDGAGRGFVEIDGFSGQLNLLLLLRLFLCRGLGGGGLEGEQVGEGRVLLFLGLLGDSGPEFPFLSNPAGAGFRALMGELRRLGVFLRLLGSAKQLRTLGAKLHQLFHDGVRGRLGRTRGHEWAGLKGRVFPKAPVKPDRKLAGDLDGVQGVAVIARALVRSAVPDDTDLMEKIEDFARNGALELEAAQQVGLRLIRYGQKAGARGGLARQLLAELAQLDKAGGGVFGKVPLGQSAETVELLFVGP